ncbi:hypothetical protein J5690_01530 [bacterium]|nr:hypothetical protein [bacterium]
MHKKSDKQNIQLAKKKIYPEKIFSHFAPYLPLNQRQKAAINKQKCKRKKRIIFFLIRFISELKKLSIKNISTLRKKTGNPICEPKKVVT